MVRNKICITFSWTWGCGLAINNDYSKYLSTWLLNTNCLRTVVGTSWWEIPSEETSLKCGGQFWVWSNMKRKGLTATYEMKHPRQTQAPWPNHHASPMPSSCKSVCSHCLVDEGFESSHGDVISAARHDESHGLLLAPRTLQCATAARCRARELFSWCRAMTWGRKITVVLGTLQIATTWATHLVAASSWKAAKNDNIA